MSVIRTILTPTERKRLNESDHRYLKKQIEGRTLLNKMLNRRCNCQLLDELKCILDRAPLPRQASGRFIRGQICRLSNGVRYPCFTRPMNEEEKEKYEVKEQQ